MSKTSISVRPVCSDDAADLYQIVSDPRVNTTLVQLPSMEISETQAWLGKKRPGQHRMVAEIDGRVVGSSSMTQYQNPRLAHGGRIGLMIHHDYWGQGVGSALIAAQINLADNWLNLYRIELEVLTHNTAAIHLYEKFGFEIEGTRQQAVFGGDGHFHDEYQMARLYRTDTLHDSPTAPPPPRPAQPLQGVQVEIRPLHPDDLSDLYALWRRSAVCRTTLQLPSQEIGRTQERMENPPAGGHRLAAIADNHLIGLVTVFQDQTARMAHSAHLGMMVHPDYWGIGVGSQLMAAILDIADNWLNLKRVDLEVNVDNPPAVHLYEKFGFVIEGRKRYHSYGDGRWADSYFMARLRE